MAAAHHLSKTSFVSCLFLSLLPQVASALPGATVDSTDQFPYVVEIRLRDRLICSGTVLYPRIVVTAAHCLQEKAYWRGGEVYLEQYLAPAELSVGVFRNGGARNYAVSEIAVSPLWRTLSRGASIQRFPYDLALVITKEPISVNSPPSLFEAQRGQADFAKERGVRQGVLVAFGGQRCSSAAQCEDAGIRRVLPVVLKENSYCFKNTQGSATLAVWCMETGVMPGDSGGALLVEGDDRKFYYAGVISAHRRLPFELAAIVTWRPTLAAALYPNVAFITKKAKELGYEP